MRLLSYPLSSATPTYGDNPPVRITPESLIREGGVANWYRIESINHNGTHVDAPWHYNDRGRTVTDLDLDEWVFTSPRVIDLPRGEFGLITDEDLAAQEDRIAGADLLLVRTGWAQQYRESDPERFGRRPPGFESSAARYLMERQPTVRAVGMDFPSASSPGHADEGHEFHRITLGARGGNRYVLIVEDMRLDPDLTDSELGRVLVVPLMLEKLDGAPVTVLAEPRS